MTEVMDRPSTARRLRLGLGVGLVGVLLLLDLYLGLVLAWAWFSPWPPGWPGVIISLLAALTGPAAAFLVWRSGRRSRKQSSAIWGRIVLVSGVIGLCSFVVLFGMIFLTAI